MNRLIILFFSFILLLIVVGCGLPQNFHKPTNSHKIEFKSTKPIMSKSEEKINVLNPEQIIPAEVLLISATGITVDENTLITSDNIEDYLPAAETTQIVSQYFKNNGFEVTPLVGISFTIYAPARHFSDFFNTSLGVDEARGIRVLLNSSKASSELPLNLLPDSIKNLIVTITFSAPANFDSTEFSSY